jgi:alpha-1,2-mannosyltransferase
MPDSRSRALTPEQHTAIRQQLALIPVYVWIVYVWGISFSQMPLRPATGDPSHLARDFLHFYAQGVITSEHDDHALYDIHAMGVVADRVLPVPLLNRYPPVYGPQVGLLFRPLASLDYIPALYTWLSLTLVLTAACVYALWRARASARTGWWPTLVLTLGAPGLHFTLSFGQASVIGLICFTVFWLALKRGHMFVAGLAVGALAYKPQLGVVAGLVLIACREWRGVAGAVFSVLAQAAASAAYWGVGIFAGYVNALRELPGVLDAMEPDKALMHSWRSMLLQLGVPAPAALGISVALSVATIAVAILAWRSRGPLALRFVVLVLATLLVDPHLYAYDLLVLVPALFACWDWANTEDDAPLTAAAAFVYSAPIVTVALPFLPVQWSVVGFALLGVMTVRRLSWRADYGDLTLLFRKSADKKT